MPGDRVDYVIMGQVLQAGAGQIPSRQAAVAGGIPMTVPSLTINKVCLSGLDAIALAAQLIRAGEFDIVVAGGMESMSQAPHLLPGARRGFKYGSAELVDSMAHDGLTDAFDHVSMGESTEGHNAKLGITRQEQDEFAARSHQLAARAVKDGLFAAEIVARARAAAPRRAGDLRHRRGDPRRDHRRVPGRAEARLRPRRHDHRRVGVPDLRRRLRGGGHVGRGGASAAGATVLAEVGAHGVVAGPDNSLHSQPSRAIERALGKAGLAVPDLDLIEINEAFAAVAIQSIRDLGVDQDRVNVNGGAIALGHPIGASGARIALHLIYELGRRGGGLGAAALCGGGGQGDALLLRVPAPASA